jgi:hypothetical protein
MLLSGKARNAGGPDGSLAVRMNGRLALQPGHQPLGENLSPVASGKDERDYSCRSVTMGSTLVARKAGR